jgi:N-acetylneuraminic acid mutarotase
MKKTTYSFIFFAIFFSGVLQAQSFTWMKGPSVAAQWGVYGVQGMTATANNPGSRSGAVSWKDANGNFWMFGGNGKDENGNTGLLNDLWKYTPATNLWTWMSGDKIFIQLGKYGTLGTPSTTNCPGARELASGWADGAGNLWLFGGFGYGSTNLGIGMMNDLWKYNISTGEWTWMTGSDMVDQPAVYGSPGSPSPLNIPGGREGAVTWTDNSGIMWMMGGLGIGTSTTVTGKFSDLWQYYPQFNQWIWVTGSNSPDQKGSYGTKGTPSPANKPGCRYLSTGWFDSGGNLWLFGGEGFEADSTSGLLNDLWKYSIAGNQWTWVNGSDTILKPGVYGNVGSSSPSNIPGGRKGAMSWADGAGNFWLFGGNGRGDTTTTSTGNLQDLWKYERTTNRFAWIKGSKTVNVQGSYGTMGLPGGPNIPGGRFSAAHWIDASNNIWMFGGKGQDVNGTPGTLSDLWTYKNCYINPPTIYITSNDSVLCIGESAVLSALGSNNFTWDNGPSTYSIAVTPTATSTYTVYTQDNTGCFYRATFTQTVSACAATAEHMTEVPALFPNPCDGKISIRTAGYSHITIYDLSGRLVSDSEISGTLSTIVIEVPSGLYYYTLTGENKLPSGGKLSVTRN